MTIDPTRQRGDRREVRPGRRRRRLRDRRRRRPAGHPRVPARPATAGGFTLLGAATVIADFTLPGDTSQVAARLLDVAPDGEETLPSRGLWRPAAGGPTKQVFQLHPNGWTFAEGHVPKLELLPKDAIPGLARRLRPGLQRPGARRRRRPRAAPAGARAARLPDGLVGPPARASSPEGYELAADFAALPDPQLELTKSNLKRKGPQPPATALLPGRVRLLQLLRQAQADDEEAEARGGQEAEGPVAKRSFKWVAGGKTKEAGAEADEAGEALISSRSP